MPDLVSGIHDLVNLEKVVDGWNKSGHDAVDIQAHFQEYPVQHT
jgi:hypothetical protein